MSPPHDRAVLHLLTHCGGLVAGERVVIVADPSTAAIADAFAAAARGCGGVVAAYVVPGASIHGQEPPAEVAAAMAGGRLVIGLTRMSMAHTRARLACGQAGGRYLSLPDYSWELLADPAVTADFRGRAPVVRRFADAFTAGQAVRVTSRAGTDLRLAIGGRGGNFCPGFVSGPGDLGSPPDIEANVSPLETRSEGVIVVDGSIPCAEIGLLHQPVTLRVAGGRIVAIDGGAPEVAQTLASLFERVGSDKAYVLAECGVGLNESARLTGTMLTDEGANGCVHFGFGSNATVGGVNDVAFHLDFVTRIPTLAVDGHVLIDEGSILP